MKKKKTNPNIYTAICISEPGGEFEIRDSNEDDAMGQDAVYFYNYQQDITYGTTCHLEKSDLSLADDGRGQMTLLHLSGYGGQADDGSF